MSEATQPITSNTSTFESFWSAEQIKGVDRSFINFDYITKYTVSISEQDYIICGEGKEEIVKAETVTEALSKTQIKKIDKVQTLLGKKNTIFLENEITKSTTN